MKLLYLSERPAFPRRLGGAARSAHSLLQSLVTSRAMDVVGVSSLDGDADPASYTENQFPWALGIEGLVLDLGYPMMFAAEFGLGLRTIVDRFQPDLVLTQLDHAYELSLEMRSMNLPVIWYVRDGLFDPGQLQEAVQVGVGLICVSQFLQDDIYRKIGHRPHLARSIIHFEKYQLREREARVITMFGPVTPKGFSTYLEIVRAFPDHKFRVVESWEMGKRAMAEARQAVEQLPNLSFVRRVEDVRTLYREASWLLIPSIVPEGGPRVALEAQACGVPVLGSGIGGIPELIARPDQIVANYWEPNAWIQSLEAMLANEKGYEQRSEAALAFAAMQEFSVELNLTRFIQAVDDTLGNTHSHSRS